MRFRTILSRINRRDAATVIGAVVLSIAVVYVLVTTTASNARMRQQFDSLSASYADLYQEAVVAGADPEAPAPEEIPEPDDSAPEISIPDPVPGPTGETGARGPGPTQAQVVQALSAYCSNNDCTPAPTVAQVAAAIADFCGDGGCRGEDGTDGQNGQDGAPGRPPTAEEISTAVTAFCADGSCRGADGADGKPGPPPTDAQVAEQVELYCAANNGCQGDTGDTGAKGDTGIGIESITCPDNENDDWIVTLTNDSQQIVPGPCRVSPIIETP